MRSALSGKWNLNHAPLPAQLWSLFRWLSQRGAGPLSHSPRRGHVPLGNPLLQVQITLQEGLRKMERETGFEPATLALARRCSTTELFPLTFLRRGRGFY